jgi:hypothetical protein
MSAVKYCNGKRNLWNYACHKTQWPESASELYRPSDRGLSAKLLPTFADRGRHVVSVPDPYGRILGILDRTQVIYLYKLKVSLVFSLKYHTSDTLMVKSMFSSLLQTVAV